MYKYYYNRKILIIILTYSIGDSQQALYNLSIAT